jgi:hypothetical protein
MSVGWAPAAAGLQSAVEARTGSAPPASFRVGLAIFAAALAATTVVAVARRGGRHGS